MRKPRAQQPLENPEARALDEAAAMLAEHGYEVRAPQGTPRSRKPRSDQKHLAALMTIEDLMYDLRCARDKALEVAEEFEDGKVKLSSKFVRYKRASFEAWIDAHAT